MNLAALSVSRATRRGFGSLRDTGDRLTGGGLRSLAKRVVTISLRSAMRRPFLKALGRSVLQPFPNFSTRLYHLATAPDTVAKTSTSLPLLVNCLYKAALGRLPDESDLAYCVHALQSGRSLDALAEHLVRLAEFQTRHGSSQRVDINYVTALYRDGLGRQPDPEGLAHWLAEGEKGATRAKVVAAFAGSAEAPAFEEMAAAFHDHVKMWKAPPACEAGMGRYAILVCNWLSTSVPFFSAEIACALRQEGRGVTVLWDSARVGVEAPSEAKTKIIGDTIRALPPWLEVVDVNGAAAAMPASLADTIDKVFRDNAIWFAKGEVPAADLLKSKSAEREEFLNHAAVVLKCLQSCGADRLIIPGGVFGLSGIYLACAAHLGVPFTTYDMGWASLMVSHDGCATHFADFKIAFAKTKEVIDRNPRLASYIRRAAMDTFRERMAGKDAIQTQKVAANHEALSMTATSWSV